MKEDEKYFSAAQQKRNDKDDTKWVKKPFFIVIVSQSKGE